MFVEWRWSPVLFVSSRQVQRRRKIISTIKEIIVTTPKVVKILCNAFHPLEKWFPNLFTMGRNFGFKICLCLTTCDKFKNKKKTKIERGLKGDKHGLKVRALSLIGLSSNLQTLILLILDIMQKYQKDKISQ